MKALFHHPFFHPHHPLFHPHHPSPTITIVPPPLHHIPFSSLSFSSPSASPPNPIIVVGSANADIYVEIPRLPVPGETISATTGRTLPGGKGANQACCAARLSLAPVRFLGRIGDDAHGALLEGALRGCGVQVEGMARVEGPPTGHAVVMLQPGGENSIVIVGGANMLGWPERMGEEDTEVVMGAGVVLLQREIPDSVNIQAAEAAKSSGVPVILDVGGVETPIPKELLCLVDILSPNETELARLTGVPTETFEDISKAVRKCHEMGVKQLLVKLGEKGSALFVEGEEPIRQPIIPAAKVLDTTGAGDTFTAAYAVSLVEGKTRKEALQFAAAAASLCVQVKGAIPSMPRRDAVIELLESL